MTNRRSTPRVPFTVQTELFLPQANVPAMVINLSPGGVLLSTAADLHVGQTMGMGLRLMEALREAAGLDYLNFELTVLERITNQNGADWYRCKSTASSGSVQYQRAYQVVLKADEQRQSATRKKKFFGRKSA